MFIYKNVYIVIYKSKYIVKRNYFCYKCQCYILICNKTYICNVFFCEHLLLCLYLYYSIFMLNKN